MPALFLPRLHRTIARQRYRAMMLAGLMSLAGIGGCTTGIDTADISVVPSPTLAPAPAADPAPVADSLPQTPQLELAPQPQPVEDVATENVRLAVGVNEKVEGAIKNATRVVGIRTSYLMVVAARESSFDPRKCAHRTSATGLYQFTADTWLRAVHAFGARHGLEGYAREITLDRHGTVSMRNAAARTKLLRLRADPRLSALMAAELARDNETRLTHILGRPVTPAELYMAHLLGVVQAARVIEAARSAPYTPGARLLPAAARANPGVFKPLGRMASARAIVHKITVYYERQELRYVQRTTKATTRTAVLASMPG
jgi:soluble lytic murein transglycosylase-like protein